MYVGKPLPRDEDYRFLTGRGRYVDDVPAPGAAHAVFARAAHVSEIDIRTTRVTGSAIEPRAYLGAYDPADGRYTLHASSQIPQALKEQVVYDEAGQLLTASFLDYAVPRADMMPPLRFSYRQTPSPHTLLGVKGVGECGSNGPPGAIGNALMDALWDLGVRHFDPPYTPFRVWQAIERASATL